MYDEILFNGATVDLPAAFRSGLNDPVDIGVGSVHRIDNPRGQARHDR